MTENETKAIKWMKSVKDHAVVTLDHIRKHEPNVSPMLYEGREKKAETIMKAFEELEKYRQIGTVEECQEARGKQVPKRTYIKEIGVSYINAYCTCAKCDTTICMKCESDDFRKNVRHCPNCGQKLDWSDNDD